MSYVDPIIKKHFAVLSDELKIEIMNRNVELHTVEDLVQVIENIMAGG